VFLRGLYHLSEQLLEAPVVNDDDKTVAKQILAPLLDRRGYRKQLTHIGGRAEESWYEGLAEKGYGMALL